MLRKPLNPEEIVNKLKSVEIKKARAKLDVEDYHAYNGSCTEKLQRIKTNDEMYIKHLVIHVDIKFNDRWAKINTTMKDRLLKERILKCIDEDYQIIQVGVVRTELQNLINRIVEAGSDYAQQHKENIIKQCENERLLCAHQNRSMRSGTYADALVIIYQLLEKHPEIDLLELTSMWNKIQVKNAMDN